MVFIDRDEPEGLLSAGERRQHFGCAKNCSCVGKEHEVDAGALIEWALQVQQSAGDGNDLQFASNTESALEAKDSRGWVGKLQAGRSRIGFGWQEINHCRTIMFPWLRTRDITEDAARKIASRGLRGRTADAAIMQERATRLAA